MSKSIRIEVEDHQHQQLSETRDRRGYTWKGLYWKAESTGHRRNAVVGLTAKCRISSRRKRRGFLFVRIIAYVPSTRRSVGVSSQ